MRETALAGRRSDFMEAMAMMYLWRENIGLGYDDFVEK